MKQLEFPAHLQLYITHNGHRTNYESVSEYLDFNDRREDMEEIDIQNCINKDEIWEIQLYPVTPISFYWVASDSLERAIKLIWEATNETT